MREIGNISTDGFQKQSIPTEQGPLINLEIYFIPLQLMWVISKLEFDGFTVQNIRICNSPNLLHQFSNVLPFGIACQSKEKREPTFLEDFSEGSSRLFLLDESEVAAVGKSLSGN